MARVAGILTVLHSALEGADSAPQSIGKVAISRAFEFVRSYVIPMAERVFGTSAIAAETRGARRLARLIVEEWHETVNIREIQKRQRTHLNKSAEIEAAIDVLVQARWLTLEVGKSGPPGGRPLHLWRVNPRVFELAGEVSSGNAGFAGLDKAAER
jgi:hypothetical protein